jgi:protease II
MLNSAIDVRVQPWQQAKFAQALRAALRRSDPMQTTQHQSKVPPVLMITDFFNGHMGPDDAVQQADTYARVLAWMLAAVGEE